MHQIKDLIKLIKKSAQSNIFTFFYSCFFTFRSLYKCRKQLRKILKPSTNMPQGAGFGGL